MDMRGMRRIEEFAGGAVGGRLVYTYTMEIGFVFVFSIFDFASSSPIIRFLA
jgi:hypothetical protein